MSPKANTFVRQSLISVDNLKEGQVFDNEINRIMSIVDNVERQFCETSVNQDFQMAIKKAVHERKNKIDLDEAVTQTQLLN